MESEFARPLQAMKREGATLVPLLRQAWDGGCCAYWLRVILIRPLVPTYRSLATLRRMSCAACWAIQTCRMVSPTDSYGSHPGEPSSCPSAGNATRDDRAFPDRLADAASFARTVNRLEWTSDARKIWEQAYPALTDAQPGMLGSVVNRAEGGCARLAMLTALINESRGIESEHLSAALAIVAYAERLAA